MILLLFLSHAAAAKPTLSLRPDQSPAGDAELRDAITSETTAEVSQRLSEAVCRSEAAHDIQQSMSAEVAEKISSEFLPGFIKSGLNPVAKAIASPFSAIIGLAFSNGPVTDMMVDVVVIMIITGVVKRSMPGALKMVCGTIVEELVFALPPILVLTITASLAYKLKYSLTAVILGAVQRYMEKNQPVLVSGLSHALVHGLHK